MGDQVVAFGEVSTGGVREHVVEHAADPIDTRTGLVDAFAGRPESTEDRERTESSGIISTETLETLHMAAHVGRCDITAESIRQHPRRFPKTSQRVCGT